jgi:hypothetical protein
MGHETKKSRVCTALSLLAGIASLVAGVRESSAQAPPPYPYPYPYPQPTYVYPYPPPQMYPPPTVIVAQPAPPPQPPSVIHDWDPEAAVPQGYRMVDTINGRLLGTGIGLLASGWLISVLVGSVGAAAAEEDRVRINDPENEDFDDTDPDDWTPLYVPVVGPFLAMGTLDPKPSGTGLLIVDGVVQTGGALCIVLGIVDRKYKLVRNDIAGVEVTPVSGPKLSGLSASGRF